MRSVGRDSHAARAPKTITTNHDAGKHGQTAFETPTTWRYALIRIFPAPRPATRHSAHEYSTISGRGRDTRGEVTRTLDDASESWTKANRENAGRSRHEAIETKDVSGNARSDLGVAQDDEQTSERKQLLRKSIN